MPSNKKESHLDENRPATLDGLDDQTYVTYTANTNDTLKGIRIHGNRVTLFFERSVRNHSTGEVLMRDVVREVHELANIGDQLLKNIAVMRVAANIKGSATITRSDFFSK